MRGITAGMLIGGALAGFMVAAAYNDFDLDDLYRSNARVMKKAKRKINRQMHSMGLM